MRSFVACLFAAFVAVGCGGGKPAPATVGNDTGVSLQDVNAGLKGNIYLDGHSWYKALDIATGKRQDVYWMDNGRWATPRKDGKEFAIGANETKTGSYYSNEDIVIFNVDGQETDRIMIDGEVRGIVKISPNGRYLAFDWYKDSKESGLVVLERNGSWERNLGYVNGRGFDWTSEGALIFSRENEIYRVDDVEVSGVCQRSCRVDCYFRQPRLVVASLSQD